MNKFWSIIIGLMSALVYVNRAIAYIPPTRMILQKTVESSGSGPYLLEQIVEFPNGIEPIQVRESWVIENDHSMKLSVSGEKSFKNSVRFQYVYAGGQRHRLVGAAKEAVKAPADFLQKYFFFRDLDAMGSFFVKEKILPANSWAKKTLPKQASEIVFEPESWVRLGRIGGTVNYAFGEISNTEVPGPGLWIEQDQFVIRKLRLSSNVELFAEGYKEYSKGLNYPDKQTIHWDNNTVTIQTVSLKSTPAKSFKGPQPSSIDSAFKVDGLGNSPAQKMIEAFYSRFR